MTTFTTLERKHGKLCLVPAAHLPWMFVVYNSDKYKVDFADRARTRAGALHLMAIAEYLIETGERIDQITHPSRRRSVSSSH